MLFISTLFFAVSIQIISILGIFFVLGFIHARIQYRIHKTYQQTLGWKGILWTAWIGTPVHELGHAFFAKLFRHKIHKINLFRPDKASGNLGHVEHSFNPRSIYQRMGNFFIGAAPMIWGSIVLITLLYLFIPDAKNIFVSLTEQSNTLSSFFHNIISFLSHLFTIENFSHWQFWIFLYLSFAISSHMAPSKADRKGMWSGLILIIFFIILINAITLYFGTDITHYIIKLTQYLNIFIALFIYALLLSIIHAILSFVILIPFKK